MRTVSTTALIVAAGQGVRAGGGLPKQFRLVGGRSVVRSTLDLFLGHPAIDRVLAVIGADDAAQYHSVAPQHEKLLQPVAGGETRQDSVRLGLEALAATAPDRVLIHDAVRPFASPELIDRVISGLAESDAILPAMPVADTLKAVDRNHMVTATVPRNGLEAAETPQGFRFDAILAAHRRAAEVGRQFTDDAAIAEWAGIPVHVVAGDPLNRKLTTSADIEAADRRLLAEAALATGDVRVATGSDVDAFGPGAVVPICGVAIPHSRGVIGHSDGDVALHALTDAILGTIAEGDIGDHFPPSDPQWKGAASDRFILFAVERVRARGGEIAHLDVAIIAEAPRIAVHRARMRARVAEICGISMDRVAVKATTNEALGFIGRGEGIAAIATATIRLPFAAP